MEAWHCFRCEEKMKEDEVTLTYKGTEFPGIPGIKCPQCGVEYLLEKFVVEEVREGEQLLESK